MPSTSCKGDGKCDGAGACRNWPLNTICQAASCSAVTNQLIAEGKCDGDGTCVVPPPLTCAPFLCEDATRCRVSCTMNSHCAGTNTCNSGSCGLKANGSACASGSQCQSGFCVDGLCCNEACSGTCRACDLAASPGTCVLVPAGQDPDGECPVGSGANATCAPGGCDGGKPACRYAVAGVECRQASCDVGLNRESAASACNGAGACPAAVTRSCAPFACGATACRNTCATSADCTAGHYCEGTTCLPLKGLGASCGAPIECASGFCAPGVNLCCNRACDGQCESCAANGECQILVGNALLHHVRGFMCGHPQVGLAAEGDVVTRGEGLGAQRARRLGRFATYVRVHATEIVRRSEGALDRGQVRQLAPARAHARVGDLLLAAGRGGLLPRPLGGAALQRAAQEPIGTRVARRIGGLAR